jgi:hypothetical protein
VAVVVAALLLLVAGAVVAATDQTDRGRAVSDEVAAVQSGGAAGADFDSSAAREPAPPGGTVGSPIVPPAPDGKTVDPAGPRIVRTADLAVGLDEGRFAAAFDRVASIATANGGFVVSSSTVTDQDGDGDAGRGASRPVAGQATLRVAADRFDTARLALTELGTVERQTISGEDVGGQLVDYEARLRSLQAQEESLRTLLARAGAVGEVLQVQNALFDVRRQVEQLQGQRDRLSQAAELATITVSLAEPGAGLVPRSEPTGLARSIERALDGAVAVVGGMIVVVGWLTPVAILGLIVWGGVRLRRRTARPAAPAPAAP